MLKKMLIAAAFVVGSVGLTQTASAYDCYGGGYRGGYGGYGAYRAPVVVPVPVYGGSSIYRSGYRGGFNSPYRSFYGPSGYGRGFGGPGFGGPGFGGSGFGYGSPLNYGRRGGVGISIGF